MEEKIYQGYIYRRAGPNEPWTQVGPAQQRGSTQQGTIVSDPYRARNDARADEDQGFQRGNLELSREAAEARRKKEAIENPQKLRTEYSGLPEIKEYRVASQQSVNALKTDPTPQGDLALVYAFAKAMDPGSVVRDAEAGMVTNSQPWFQSTVENAKKQFGMDGAGNFTAQTRARLRTAIIRALASRQPLYDTRRKEFGALAESNGIKPADVIGTSDTDAFAQQFRDYAKTSGDEGGVIASLLGQPVEQPKAAGYGATEGSVNLPPEMQQAHSDYLAKHWGNIDPQDYAAFRINLDKQYGFGSDPEAYKASVPDFNKFAAQGGFAPQLGSIPAVKKELSGFDQFRNNVLSNPVGAGASSALNAAGFGLPSLFAPEQTQALREEYPVSSFVGEVGGGIAGTGLAGAGLRSVARSGEGAVARALANPLTADAGYGAVYGATQADDPLYGAVGGGLAGVAGNRLGGALAREVAPNVMSGGAVRAADNAVPTSQELKDLAGGLYDQAEGIGVAIPGDDTLALADTTSDILRREGRLTPKDKLTEVQTKTKEAYNLIGDYAGEPMGAKNVQTVRSVLSDGLSSQDKAEARIARLLLNNFDSWTDGVAPELAEKLAEARGVSSRYLQGDRIALANEKADIRASQFSNSGAGNAVRTDFRALDRRIADGVERFAPEVEDAIRVASRGTPLSNSLRNVGKFGVQHPLNAGVTIAAGGGLGGPIGGAGGAALAGAGTIAQLLSNRMTARFGEVAENAAYGGPQYTQALEEALATAQRRGGHVGAAAATDIARILSEQAGY